MEKLIEKANILLEALPYIRAFYNKTIIIKFGGNAMVNEELKKDFALDIILMKYVGMNPVIVHGGGPQIGEVIEKMGLKSNFIDGMRVTNKETMDIVEMVLVGKINKEIVNLINQNGGKAVGLSGKDAELIKAKKLNIVKSFAESKPSEIIDLGMVGEVESIDPTIIEILDKKKLIPVIAPVGVGEKGETYNINADLVAGEIASALAAEKLILLTDTKGVLDKDGSLIHTLNIEQSNKLIKEKVITGGMIPKIQCCLNALNKGVKKAHIIDGRIAHAVLLEIFTDEGIGSQIVK